MRAAALILCGTGTVHAEVLSATAHNFSIRQIAQAPLSTAPQVWAALSQVAKWWDPEHTYSGVAGNLTLEPVVSGCFCEKLGLYAGVEHARVIYAEPAKVLRLSGALGPLQPLGVQGVMTWQIAPADSGSRITLTYRVGGYTDEPLGEWAAAVDEVLGAQLQRLARLLTLGDPQLPKQ